MKSVWTALLLKVVQYLTSAEFIELVKSLVLSLINDKSKTGEEKRTVVLNEIKKSGTDFGTSLASLAIESTLTYLKARIK